MNIKDRLNRIAALFAEEEKTKMSNVKTDDNKLIFIDGESLAIDSPVMWLDEAGEKSAIADGDITLDDKRVITVKDGKVTAIVDAPVETEEDDTVETEMNKATVKMAVIKQIMKWSMDVDQDSLEVGTILTQTYTDENGVAGEPCPVAAGEYEMENGDKVQVDADGKIVLITKPGAPVETEAPAPAIDEAMKALEERFAKLEQALVAKQEEVKKVEQTFAEWKGKPAVKAVDTRKVESTKTESKFSSTQKRNTRIDELFEKFDNKNNLNKI